MGLDDLPQVNTDEAQRLNQELSDVKGDFDFTGKKIGFAKSLILRSKNEYFEESKEYLDDHNFMGDKLIVLNAEEKDHANGYDAIIISYLPKAISERFRASMIKKIATQ